MVSGVLFLLAELLGPLPTTHRERYLSLLRVSIGLALIVGILLRGELVGLMRASQRPSAF